MHNYVGRLMGLDITLSVVCYGIQGTQQTRLLSNTAKYGAYFYAMMGKHMLHAEILGICSFVLDFITAVYQKSTFQLRVIRNI